MTYLILPDVPFIPESCKMAVMVEQIEYMARALKMPVPKELVEFVEHNRLDEWGQEGYTFETELIRVAGDWSAENLQKWVDYLPQGLARAELRAMLKRKIQA